VPALAGRGGAVTFCLAFARSTFALVAGDTRVRTREVPLDATDIEALPAIVTDGGDRKLSRLRSGWMTGGPLMWWLERTEDALADVDAADRAALLAALRRSGSNAMRLLEAEHPTVAADVRRRMMVLVTAPAGNRFGTVGVNWAGDELAPGMHPFTLLAAWPHGVAPGTAQALAARFQGTLQRVEGRPGEFLAAVRATAALFREVSDLSGPEGSVSAQVEIGALTRSSAGAVQRRHLRPITLDSSISDRELADLLEEEAA